MVDKQAVLSAVEDAVSKRQHTQAINVLRRAVRDSQGDAEMLTRLAALLETLKKHDQALNVYQQLAQRYGEKVPTPVAIGLARNLVALSRYKSALKLLEPLHRSASKNEDVLIALAKCRRHDDLVDEAAALIKQALAVSPKSANAIFEAAQIHLAKKNLDQAITALEKNLYRQNLHGDSLDLWMETLRTADRHRYLQEKLEDLCQKYPDKVEFVFGYAVTAHRAGQYSLARPAFDRSCALLPDSYKILYEYGVMERTAGNIEKSHALILRSLELNAEQPAALRTYGIDHKYVYGDDQFKRLNMASANLTAQQPMEQIQTHFALAKAFDDVGELDAAFKHYAIGGAKKRHQSPYAERESDKSFKLTREIVTRARYLETGQQGSDSETPVFILGMPRSGTSLMEQILASHPDIFGAGELKFMVAALDNIPFGQTRLRLGEKEPAFPYDDKATWRQRGEWYVNRLQKLADKPFLRIVDKMPGNFNHVGQIHAILPKARIIHSRRHPVETCLSIYRILFAEGHQWSYQLAELGRYYRRYWNLMQHWREQFPGVMYEIRYEDNVADVEGQAKKLIEYLGLEWNENCLNFHKTERAVKTASASQVRKPIYKTSTNRWRKYESYLGPLLEELGDIVPEYEAEIAHLQEKD